MTEKQKSNIKSEIVDKIRSGEGLRGVAFCPIPLNMNDYVSGNAIILYSKLYELALKGKYITTRYVRTCLHWGANKENKARQELINAGYLDYTETEIGRTKNNKPLYRYEWVQYFERRNRAGIEVAEDKLAYDDIVSALSERERPTEQELFDYAEPSNIVATSAPTPINIVPLDTVYTTRSAIRTRAKEYCGGYISHSVLNKLDMAFIEHNNTMTEKELELLTSKYVADDMLMAQTK